MTEQGRTARGEGGARIVPDTIVAEATAPGVAALAVVRLSGARSGEVLEALTGAATPPARVATLLPIHAPSGELIDRCVITRYEAPASYTGEDLVEISCHGGWITPARIVEAVASHGVRLAEPGEFTRRAVLNGKMDLLQAEGVIDLIEGSNSALQRIAIQQVERRLSARISDLREQLLKVEAFLVHHIDFPEEDDAPVPIERVVEEAEVVLRALERLLATAPEGELLREGAVTVFAGRPNSGKSSLFNALVGTDRAIVTEIPGTTRDALEAVVAIGGFPFRLVDTAGLRDTDEPVEKIGIEVARRYLEAADVVLFCTEAAEVPTDEERAFAASVDAPVVHLRTKSDRSVADGELDGVAEVVTVSVETGEGFDRLREVLPGLVYRGLVGLGRDMPVLTRRRQAEAVRTAVAEVGAFVEAVRSGIPAEMASTHLRPAETALEEVLGVISTDDVLDRVFREFCVGK